MALARPIEPITATDDELRAALEVADLPALLPALAHVTGDLSVLRDELRIDPLLMGEDQGGLTPEQQERIRALALSTLVAFRDGGSVVAPMPTGPDLRRILEFMAGGLEIDEYLPMMREELALTADLRAPRWHKDDVNPDKPFKVVIIGAGMSGIVAAYRLAEADVPYVVVDKNADVGGTWLENSYPGLPGRHPEPLLQLLVRPARRLAALLQPAVRAAQVLPGVRRRVRHPPEHPLQHRGVGGRLRRGDGVVERRGRRRRRPRVDDPGQRRDQRRRPAQPAAAAEDRGA